MEKLIKLSDTHYIVVDDSEINVNDFITDKYKVWQWKDNSSLLGRKKVTHSTQPLEECGEELVNDEWIPAYVFGDTVERLPLSEVEEVINGYSVEKIAKDLFGYDKNVSLPHYDIEVNNWLLGFKAHQELVKDKLFTVEEAVEFTMKMLAQYIQGNTNIWNRQLLEESIKNSMVLKTEWNIKFDENGKIKLI